MIILDSSVMLKWMEPQEAYVDDAIALLNLHVVGLQKIAVPDIAYAEVLVTLRKWDWSPEQIQNGLGFIFTAELETIPSSLELLTKAANLAEKLRRPKRETFDSIFLAAALLQNAPLVTADIQLVKWASNLSGIKTYHLGDIKNIGLI